MSRTPGLGRASASRKRAARLSELFLGILLCGLATAGSARQPASPVSMAIDLAGRAEEISDDLSLTLGNYAEPALAEYRSFAAVVRYLASAGFKLQAGAGNIPTALVASWGAGRPALGIRAGMDADRVTGHSLGHNLEAAASVAAAIALKESLRELGLPGTVKLFLYPVGSALDAGPYLAAAGFFSELDALITARAGVANRGDLLAEEALRDAGCPEVTGAEGSTGAAEFVGYVAKLVPTTGFTFSAWAPGTCEGSLSAAKQSTSVAGAESARLAAKALSALGMRLLADPEALATVKTSFLACQRALPAWNGSLAIPVETFPEAPGITVRPDGMVRFVSSPSVSTSYVMVPEPLEEVRLGAYDCGV